MPQAEHLRILQELPNSLSLWQMRVAAGVWVHGHNPNKKQRVDHGGGGAKREWKNVLCKSTESKNVLCKSTESNTGAHCSPRQPQWCKVRSLEASVKVVIECRSRGANREWKNVLCKSMEHQWKCCQKFVTVTWPQPTAVSHSPQSILVANKLAI